MSRFFYIVPELFEKLQILTLGEVNKPPAYDEEYGQWKYKVEGKTTDGEKATVVVTIVSYNEILGITIMDK